MTSQGNGESVPYKVSMFQATKAVLKHLHAQAIQAGTGHTFLTALSQIIERLRSDPMAFGEPRYRLPALKLLVRQGIVLPLVVHYAVHEEQRLVFIRDFKVLA